MSRVSASILLVPLLAACGDDGKTAPRGPPQAPPATSSGSLSSHGTPSPEPARPPPPAPARTGPPFSPWRATRVGDVATWEIRVIGSTSVTKLTWRATQVDAAGVRYAVQARTLDVEGATKSLVESEELHAADAATATTPGGVPEPMTVAGRALETERFLRGEGPRKTTIWISDAVPFSGLVKSTNADVEQVLVAFSRGS